MSTQTSRRFQILRDVCFVYSLLPSGMKSGGLYITGDFPFGFAAQGQLRDVAQGGLVGVGIGEDDDAVPAFGIDDDQGVEIKMHAGVPERIALLAVLNANAQSPGEVGVDRDLWGGHLGGDVFLADAGDR